MYFKIIDRVADYREHKEQYWAMRSILQKVLQGELTREDCKEGLCTLIGNEHKGVDLALPDALEGYKHWSGKVGYIIYVGEIDHAELARDANLYRDAAISQYEREFESNEYDSDEYWQARLELARHWIRFIDKVIEESQI